MATERLTFPGAGGETLSARLEMPDTPPIAWALFAHCFTCSKNVRAAVEITRGLSSRGIAVLRFDFTGLGESEGDFADTNFSSNVDDLVAAARFLEEKYEAPSILVGHSLGGAAVLQAASGLSAVRAVATIGAPADPAHVLHLVEGSAEDIERDGEARVTIAGRPFCVKKQFLDDLDARNVERVVGSLGRPLLVFHSPVDEIVGIDNAASLYSMARHPKSFVSLDTADHLLSDARDSGYVAAVLSAWAGKYVDAAPATEDAPSGREATAPSPNPAPVPNPAATPDPEGRVVTRTPAGAYRTTISVREHALLADEPAAVGGQDAGPTPYEYVLAGLGACTSMTLQMYARRKDWPLEEARVRLAHQRVHARDCEDCEESDTRMDEIAREVELVGPLDEEQTARLMEIADRCPVHRTLDAGIRIRTTRGGTG